jgi:hypothetical protein
VNNDVNIMVKEGQFPTLPIVVAEKRVPVIGVALLYLLEPAGFFAANGFLTEISQKVTKFGDVSLDFPRRVNDWRRVEQAVYSCQLLNPAVWKITQSDPKVNNAGPKAFCLPLAIRSKGRYIGNGGMRHRIQQGGGILASRRSYSRPCYSLR